MVTDLRQLPREDQALVGVGVLAFIASFLPYYGASLHGMPGRPLLFGGNVSTSVTAWHGWNIVALLLMLAVTAIAAVRALAPETELPSLPVSWNFILVAVSAVSSLIYVVRTFTLDSGNVLGIDFGLRWGAYVLLILLLAHTVLAAMRLRSSGEATRWTDAGASPPPAS